MKDAIIFIPTYNGVKLEETLDSIPSHIPSIVFDNKKADWPLARTWNYALDTLTNEYRYVIISNDDVIFRPDTVDDLVAGIGKDFCIVNTAYDVNKLDERGKVWYNSLEGYMGWFCFCTTKELPEKVGWFDEHFSPAYFEDADMEVRIRLAGYEVYTSTPVVHLEGQTTKNDPERDRLVKQSQFKNLSLYMRKWGGPPLGGETFRTPFNGSVRNYRERTFEPL